MKEYDYKRVYPKVPLIEATLSEGEKSLAIDIQTPDFYDTVAILFCEDGRFVFRKTLLEKLGIEVVVE